MLGLRELSGPPSPAPQEGPVRPKSKSQPWSQQPRRDGRSPGDWSGRVGGSTCREAVLSGGGEWDRESPRYSSTDTSREAGMQILEMQIYSPHPAPPSLEGQMLPWFQPDLWSEGGRGRVRGRGQSWGAAGSLVNTSSRLPSENHPAELGDFQRQFLLTSQLSWASGLLIRLVNTTRPSGGRDPPMLPAAPFPPSQPPPSTGFLCAETSVPVCCLFQPPCAGVSPCLSRSLPCCLSLSCPSLSLPVPVEEGSWKPSQP